MKKFEHTDLITILTTNTWQARKLALDYLATVTPETPPQTPANEATDTQESDLRTDDQHRALFLWFGMIEKEAENAGVTWDRVIRHVHQLRVTKENLHEACKQLIKALWGITSTKKIEKHGKIDIIIDHFVDLFAKEGLTLPPFPFDPNKNNVKLAQMENLHNLNYEEHKPTAFDE